MGDHHPRSGRDLRHRSAQLRQGLPMVDPGCGDVDRAGADQRREDHAGHQSLSRAERWPESSEEEQSNDHSKANVDEGAAFDLGRRHQIDHRQNSEGDPDTRAHACAPPGDSKEAGDNHRRPQRQPNIRGHEWRQQRPQFVAHAGDRRRSRRARGQRSREIQHHRRTNRDREQNPCPHHFGRRQFSGVT